MHLRTFPPHTHLYEQLNFNIIDYMHCVFVQTHAHTDLSIFSTEGRRKLTFIILYHSVCSKVTVYICIHSIPVVHLTCPGLHAHSLTAAVHDQYSHYYTVSTVACICMNTTARSTNVLSCRTSVDAYVAIGD